VRGWREAAMAEQARRERVEGVNVLFGRGSQAGVPASSRSEVSQQGDASIDQHGDVGGGGGGFAAASGGSCGGCENRGFRQANRSRRLGGVAGNAKRMKPGLRGDGESTTVGAAGVGSSSSAAPGVPLATSVPRGPAHVTKLRRKLCGLRLSEEIVDAVLGAMQARFGEGLAWEYAESEWLVSWPRWEVFAEEVQIKLQSWEVGFAVIHVAPLVSNLIFALFRFAIQGARVGIELSDDAKLEELKAAGWDHRVGQVWGQNNCLADSLLQLMIARGVVPSGVDREAACRANREQLENTEGLMPRTLDGGSCPGGMLEHHRHAALTIRFFLAYFGLREVEVLPSAGIKLVVHARYDDFEHPPDVDMLCARIGSSAAGAWEFNLFNWTGHGYSGYHYDPLVRSALLAGVVDLDDVDVGEEREDAVAMESLRRRVLRWQISVDPPEPSAAVLALAGKVFGRFEAAGEEVAGADAERALECGDGSAASVPAGVGADDVMPQAVPEDEMLFDAALADATRCLARVFNGRRLDLPVFRQCIGPRTSGDFCGRHNSEEKRPQGVWDPPGHASLPPAKLAVGQDSLRRRRRGSADVATAVVPPMESKRSGKGIVKKSSEAVQVEVQQAREQKQEQEARAVAGVAPSSASGGGRASLLRRPKRPEERERR